MCLAPEKNINMVVRTVYPFFIQFNIQHRNSVKTVSNYETDITLKWFLSGRRPISLCNNYFNKKRVE